MNYVLYTMVWIKPGEEEMTGVVEYAPGANEALKGAYGTDCNTALSFWLGAQADET